MFNILWWTVVIFAVISWVVKLIGGEKIEHTMGNDSLREVEFQNEELDRMQQQLNRELEEQQRISDQFHHHNHGKHF